MKTGVATVKLGGSAVNRGLAVAVKPGVVAWLGSLATGKFAVKLSAL